MSETFVPPSPIFFLTVWSGEIGLTTSSMDLEYSGGHRELCTLESGTAIRRMVGVLTSVRTTLPRNTIRTVSR